MLIDSYNLTPKTARAFGAIGGGYGVKMRIAGTDEEMLFGKYDNRDFAELVAALANELKESSSPTTVEWIEETIKGRVRAVATAKVA